MQCGVQVAFGCMCLADGPTCGAPPVHRNFESSFLHFSLGKQLPHFGNLDFPISVSSLFFPIKFSGLTCVVGKHTHTLKAIDVTTTTTSSRPTSSQ